MKRRAGKWIAAVIGISMVLGACAGGKAEQPVPGNSQENVQTEARTDGTEASESQDSQGTLPVKPKDAPMKPEDITIACVVYQEDQHQGIITQAAQQAAKDYGVQILTANTGGDNAKDLELMNTYVTQGVNGLVWAPSSEVVLTPLNNIADKGIPVTIVNGTPNANVDLSHLYGVFANDNASMSKTCGQISAPIVKEMYGDKQVKIAVLQFAALANEASSTRVNSFLDALTNEGVNYSVVTDQDAWMQDEAIQVAGDVITANPDLDIIFCANEGAIVGSTMAVKNAGKEGQIYVFGIDVSVQISQMMKESNICQVAVGQNSYEGGYRAAEQCIQVLMGDTSTEQYVQKWNACEDMVLNQREPETIDIYEQQMKDLGVMK